MKTTRQRFESYEEALNAVKDYDLYIGFGRRGIGINVSHNLEKMALDFKIEIIKYY